MMESVSMNISTDTFPTRKNQVNPKTIYTVSSIAHPEAVLP
jgi:hypothetical protein